MDKTKAKSTKQKFQTYGKRYAFPKVNTGKGLTEQSHKKECDMNYILREYTRTGFIKHAKDNAGTYDDIPVQDFQTAMFMVTEANNMFNELPGHVRKAFNNSPEDFLGFVQNPENKDKMAELGILAGNDGIDMRGVPINSPTADEPPKIQPVVETKSPAEPT